MCCWSSQGHMPGFKKGKKFGPENVACLSFLSHTHPQKANGVKVDLGSVHLGWANIFIFWDHMHTHPHTHRGAINHLSAFNGTDGTRALCVCVCVCVTSAALSGTLQCWAFGLDDGVCSTGQRPLQQKKNGHLILSLALSPSLLLSLFGSRYDWIHLAYRSGSAPHAMT